MHTSHHQPPCELEYIPGDSGLEEFDAEGGEERRPSPPDLAPRGAQKFRVFSVVEQYEPSDTALLLTPRRGAVRGDRRVVRLLERLAIAAVLVAIPSGSPVGTEGLPAPAAMAVQTPVTVQTPPLSLDSVATSVPTQVTSERQPAQLSPTPRLPPVARTKAASEPQSAASPPQLASLREALASLNGPFMTFEHCEVRLASADRAVVRCQGILTGAQPGGASLTPRRVEWTLDFDRAEQRWLIVDSTAR